MKNYPYCGRDLFAEPETYFFAACSCVDFLDGWKRSRVEFRRDLGEACAMAETPECPSEGVLLLDLLSRSSLQDIESAATIVDPLLKKYEVYKRLFAAYLSSGKRHPRSQPASLGAYIAFGEALLRQAEAGSLKHLSTLLKLCDALTSQPTELFSAEEAGRLDAVLSGELRLIEELEASS